MAQPGVAEVMAEMERGRTDAALAPASLSSTDLCVQAAAESHTLASFSVRDGL
jgi:hypothetical protein